jgi:hypothetical protein
MHVDIYTELFTILMAMTYTQASSFNLLATAVHGLCSVFRTARAAYRAPCLSVSTAGRSACANFVDQAVEDRKPFCTLALQHYG